MINTDGRPTVAMRASDPLLAQLDPVVDPADTRNCDGYPALAGDVVRISWADLEAWRNAPSNTASACTCGDPGDCSECGA